DQTVRSFWHGQPLNPYHVLCLNSFVERGCSVELFSYDASLVVPAGVRCRDANEVWPTDRVLRYQTGFGAGSPALHANLFRYAMLHRLGGWWIDMDVILLRAPLPDAPLFFARESTGHIVNGTLKFPPGNVVLAECVSEAARLSDSVQWGETGPR